MGTKWQFVYTFSNTDGSYTPTKYPPKGAEFMKQYHNYKNFYSSVLLALVDAQYRFIWESIGDPRNTHDSTLLQSTNLWSRVIEGKIFPATTLYENLHIPPIILGDGAFLMRKWLAKPNGDGVSTEEECYLKCKSSRSWMVIKGAFGRLEGRWRV